MSLLRSATVVLICAGVSAPELWAQGMATGRVVRPGVRVETNLPPIEVHFEDVAVKAGLTTVNVFGEANSKRYIVETTPEHRTRAQPELRTERGLIREFSAYGPGAVGRWRRFIEGRGADDPVFGLWNRLMALEKKEISDRALEVARGLDAAGRINPILKEALERSPPSG